MDVGSTIGRSEALGNGNQESRETGRNTWNKHSRTKIAKSLEAVAVSPFPVPLSLAGNISGVTAYKTPYIIWIIRTHHQPPPFVSRQ